LNHFVIIIATRIKGLWLNNSTKIIGYSVTERQEIKRLVEMALEAFKSTCKELKVTSVLRTKT